MPSLTRQKRGIVSATRRRDLYLLMLDYQMLQSKYPKLRLEIQDDIDDLVRQAERTRDADRGDVLRALEEWCVVGLTAEEIVDETGLSDRTVRSVLEELLQSVPPLVGFREGAPEGEPGRRPRTYKRLSEIK